MNSVFERSIGEEMFQCVRWRKSQGKLSPTDLDHVRCELSRPELKIEFVSIVPMLQFGISGSALVSIRADCSECFLIDAQWSRLVGFAISRVPRSVMHDMHI